MPDEILLIPTTSPTTMAASEVGDLRYKGVGDADKQKRHLVQVKSFNARMVGQFTKEESAERGNDGHYSNKKRGVLFRNIRLLCVVWLQGKDIEN